MPAWTEATERQLLLTVIHLLSPSPPKWDQVASLMGEGFTAESTRQRFQKLRKNAVAEFGEIGPVGGTKTPAKRGGKKANGEGPVKVTGKQKGKRAAAEDGGEQDDDEEMAVEKKKTKKVKVEKVEDDLGDEEDELS